MSRSLTAIDAARRALAAQRGGPPTALVVVADAPVTDAVGRRILVSAEDVEGSLGSPERDERATRLARETLGQGKPRLHEVELEGGRWRLYVEPLTAAPDLLIVGAGHIARPLCRLGALLGFRVTVADDRPEYVKRESFPEAARVVVLDFSDPFREIEVTAESFVVLVTRGHKYDYDCILELLRMEARPAYLGMIGSRRRVRAAFEALVADGAEPQRLAGVHAPIGLDIGAETPEEIALSIAAELVTVRRGGSGQKLSELEHVLKRVAGKSANP